MNATRSPAVRRSASTSRPPNQKIVTSDSIVSRPMPDQNAVESSASRLLSPNRPSTAPL